MQAAGAGSRSAGKLNYSCDQCRSRKLRCSRPLPCANCVSRGTECTFSPSAEVIRRRKAAVRASAGPAPPPRSALPSRATTPPLRDGPATAAAGPASQDDLLAEIQNLKRLARDLESRVLTSSSGQHSRASPAASVASAASSTASATPTPPVPPLGTVSHAVAHLERVSVGGNARDPSCVDSITFTVGPIRDMPRAATHTMHMGKPIRCLYLPRHHEARILADKFVAKLSCVYHVLHSPSVPGFIDDTYRQLELSGHGLGQVSPGHAILLLSIIASATQVWTNEDCIGEGSIFSSPAEANAQTPLWMKATHDVIAAEQNCPPVSLEALLGILILLYLTLNQEGVSFRYKALVSMGLLLGQELGLHNMDEEGAFDGPRDTIRAEVGRRAWWYLVATDWINASRYGGQREGIYLVRPRQIAVRKPRNINDVDLTDGGPNQNLPPSQPTDMSYFLQRLRLAEVSRNIMKPMTRAATASRGSDDHSHIMILDMELERMIREVPPFLNLTNYNASPNAGPHSAFIQAYLLNSLINAQRCKLHLRHLTSGLAPNNPMYELSRERCVQAARRIISAEQQLRNTREHFNETRMRLAITLHGVFTASIVILMDACLGGNRRPDTQEVAGALKMVEDLEPHSLAAGTLREALVQLLARHSAGGADDVVALKAGPFGGKVAGIADEHLRPLTAGQPFDGQLAQSLGELVDTEGFEWDDLFSTLDSSTFF